MSLMAVSAHLPERKLSKSVKQLLIEQVGFLREKGIIPMLESNSIDFENKFNNAVNYYSYYIIKINEIIVFNNVKIIKNRKTTVDSFLRALSIIKKELSNKDNEEIRLPVLDAVSKLEDYLLLARDKEINLNKAKYNPIIGASFTIWVSIMGLTEILSNEKYKNKAEVLIQKCESGTRIMEEYVMMIARDHGRVFSPEVNQTLEDVDSGRASTITQTADELIKQMRKELAREK